MIEETQQPTLFERRGAITLWREIVETLQREIAGGAFGPGAQLPSETELVARFRVHRNTVRRALEVLQERGVIRVEHGRGRFVQERVVRHHVGPTTRLMTYLHELHRVGERRFLAVAREPVDKLLAQDLQLSKNRYVRRIDSLNIVDGQPATVSSSYLPLPRFDGIERILEATGSFTEAWKAYGVTEYRRQEFRMTAIGLSGEDAKLLKLKRRQPALLTTNINVDAAGVPILVSRTRIAPQMMELVVHFGD